MNFEQRFEHLLTPEWRPFFLNYKKLDSIIDDAKQQQIALRNAKPTIITTENTTTTITTPTTVNTPSSPSPVTNLVRTFTMNSLKQDQLREIKYAAYIEQFENQLRLELNKLNLFFKSKDEEYSRLHSKLMEQILVVITEEEESSTSNNNSPDHQTQNRRLLVDKLFVKNKQIAMLREAFTEHYRVLNLLLNYRTVNETAVTHLCHKFDRFLKGKRFQNKICEMELKKCSFVTNDHIEEMINDCKNVFIDHLYRDNPGEAKRQIRLLNQLEYGNSGSAFRAGFFFGLSCLLSIMVILFYFIYYSRLPTIPYYSASALYLYRLFFYPSLLSIGVAFNVKIWNRVRINYVFIFEFPPSTHLSKWSFLMFSFFTFSTLCASCFLYMWFVVMEVNKDANFRGLSWIHPVVLWGVALIWFFFPLKSFFWGEIRVWLMKTIGRILLAPFFRVTFPDFWFADQLTSMADVLFELQFIACAFQQPDSTHLKRVCKEFQSIGVPLFNILPFYARSMQCLRRFYETRQRSQLANFFKYFLCIVVILVSFVQKGFAIGKTAKVALLWTWFALNVTSTFYKIFWDTVMDWGLILNWDDEVKEYKWSENLLRQELLFWKPVYLIAILANVLMRFMWLVSFILRTYVNLKEVDWLIQSVIVIEVIRRIIWNIFRLENEHLTNCENYRLTREIPLPFEVIASDRLKQSQKSSHHHSQHHNRHHHRLLQQHDPFKNQLLHRVKSMLICFGMPESYEIHELEDVDFGKLVVEEEEDGSSSNKEMMDDEGSTISLEDINVNNHQIPATATSHHQIQRQQQQEPPPVQQQHYHTRTISELYANIGGDDLIATVGDESSSEEVIHVTHNLDDLFGGS